MRRRRGAGGLTRMSVLASLSRAIASTGMIHLTSPARAVCRLHVYHYKLVFLCYSLHVSRIYQSKLMIGGLLS